MGLDLGYFRTSWAHFRVTDNLAVTPADFDPYCITSPIDPRLPGGGGQQMCGFYDIKPAKSGLVDNFVTLEAPYGKQTDIYNGIDLTVNARLGLGAVLTGGLSASETTVDRCSVLVDSPQPASLFPAGSVTNTSVKYCKWVMPSGKSVQVKLSGIYPLPGRFQLSGTFQNLPGNLIVATYVATNAQIAPSLGRNLGSCRGAATCAGTTTVDVIAPGTIFEKRLQQLDLRVGRMFNIKQSRLFGTFDIYNAFNADSVLSANTRYGPAWTEPIQVLGARTFKFGAQLDF